MARLTITVIRQLLSALDSTVRSYHPEVTRTGGCLSKLINGTAFFPGGTGLWRGPEPFGNLPEYFPDSPVMFVGHNFDSVRAYMAAMKNGGEGCSPFWKNLLGYLDLSNTRPSDCFFTNALMGLKPGSALGDMPSVHGYEDECEAFLALQIDIVQPSLVVALGGKARKRLAKLKPRFPCAHLMHPSAREFRALTTRDGRISAQAEILARARTMARYHEIERR